MTKIRSADSLPFTSVASGDDITASQSPWNLPASIEYIRKSMTTLLPQLSTQMTLRILDNTEDAAVRLLGYYSNAKEMPFFSMVAGLAYTAAFRIRAREIKHFQTCVTRFFRKLSADKKRNAIGNATIRHTQRRLLGALLTPEARTNELRDHWRKSRYAVEDPAAEAFKHMAAFMLQWKAVYAFIRDPGVILQMMVRNGIFCCGDAPFGHSVAGLARGAAESISDLTQLKSWVKAFSRQAETLEELKRLLSDYYALIDDMIDILTILAELKSHALLPPLIERLQDSAQMALLVVGEKVSVSAVDPVAERAAGFLREVEATLASPTTEWLSSIATELLASPTAELLAEIACGAVVEAEKCAITARDIVTAQAGRHSQAGGRGKEQYLYSSAVITGATQDDVFWRKEDAGAVGIHFTPSNATDVGHLNNAFQMHPYVSASWSPLWPAGGSVLLEAGKCLMLMAEAEPGQYPVCKNRDSPGNVTDTKIQGYPGRAKSTTHYFETSAGRYFSVEVIAAGNEPLLFEVLPAPQDRALKFQEISGLSTRTQDQTPGGPRGGVDVPIDHSWSDAQHFQPPQNVVESIPGVLENGRDNSQGNTEQVSVFLEGHGTAAPPATFFQSSATLTNALEEQLQKVWMFTLNFVSPTGVHANPAPDPDRSDINQKLHPKQYPRPSNNQYDRLSGKQMPPQPTVSQSSPPITPDQICQQTQQQVRHYLGGSQVSSTELSLELLDKLLDDFIDVNSGNLNALLGPIIATGRKFTPPTRDQTSQDAKLLDILSEVLADNFDESIHLNSLLVSIASEINSILNEDANASTPEKWHSNEQVKNRLFSVIDAVLSRIFTPAQMLTAKYDKFRFFLISQANINSVVKIKHESPNEKWIGNSLSDYWYAAQYLRQTDQRLKIRYSEEMRELGRGIRIRAAWIKMAQKKGKDTAIKALSNRISKPIHQLLESVRYLQSLRFSTLDTFIATLLKESGFSDPYQTLSISWSSNAPVDSFWLKMSVNYVDVVKNFPRGMRELLSVNRRIIPTNLHDAAFDFPSKAEIYAMYNEGYQLTQDAWQATLIQIFNQSIALLSVDDQEFFTAQSSVFYLYRFEFSRRVIKDIYYVKRPCWYRSWLIKIEHNGQERYYEFSLPRFQNNEIMQPIERLNEPDVKQLFYSGSDFFTHHVQMKDGQPPLDICKPQVKSFLSLIGGKIDKDLGAAAMSLLFRTICQVKAYQQHFTYFLQKMENITLLQAQMKSDITKMLTDFKDRTNPKGWIQTRDDTSAWDDGINFLSYFTPLGGCYNLIKDFIDRTDEYPVEPLAKGLIRGADIASCGLDIYGLSTLGRSFTVAMNKAIHLDQQKMLQVNILTGLRKSPATRLNIINNMQNSLLDTNREIIKTTAELDDLFKKDVLEGLVTLYIPWRIKKPDHAYALSSKALYLISQSANADYKTTDYITFDLERSFTEMSNYRPALAEKETLTLTCGPLTPPTENRITPWAMATDNVFEHFSHNADLFYDLLFSVVSGGATAKRIRDILRNNKIYLSNTYEETMSLNFFAWLVEPVIVEMRVLLNNEQNIPLLLRQQREDFIQALKNKALPDDLAATFSAEEKLRFHKLATYVEKVRTDPTEAATDCFAYFIHTIFEMEMLRSPDFSRESANWEKLVDSILRKVVKFAAWEINDTRERFRRFIVIALDGWQNMLAKFCNQNIPCQQALAQPGKKQFKDFVSKTPLPTTTLRDWHRLQFNGWELVRKVLNFYYSIEYSFTQLQNFPFDQWRSSAVSQSILNDLKPRMHPSVPDNELTTMVTVCIEAIIQAITDAGGFSPEVLKTLFLPPMINPQENLDSEAERVAASREEMWDAVRQALFDSRISLPNIDAIYDISLINRDTIANLSPVLPDFDLRTDRRAKRRFRMGNGIWASAGTEPAPVASQTLFQLTRPPPLSWPFSLPWLEVQRQQQQDVEQQSLLSQRLVHWIRLSTAPFAVRRSLLRDAEMKDAAPLSTGDILLLTHRLLTASGVDEQEALLLWETLAAEKILVVPEKGQTLKLLSSLLTQTIGKNAWKTSSGNLLPDLDDAILQHAAELFSSTSPATVATLADPLLYQQFVNTTQSAVKTQFAALAYMLTPAFIEHLVAARLDTLYYYRTLLVNGQQTLRLNSWDGKRVATGAIFVAMLGLTADSDNALKTVGDNVFLSPESWPWADSSIDALSLLSPTSTVDRGIRFLLEGNRQINDDWREIGNYRNDSLRLKEFFKQYLTSPARRSLKDAKDLRDSLIYFEEMMYQRAWGWLSPDDRVRLIAGYTGKCLHVAPVFMTMVNQQGEEDQQRVGCILSINCPHDDGLRWYFSSQASINDRLRFRATQIADIVSESQRQSLFGAPELSDKHFNIQLGNTTVLRGFQDDKLSSAQQICKSLAWTLNQDFAAAMAHPPRWVDSEKWALAMLKRLNKHGLRFGPEELMDDFLRASLKDGQIRRAALTLPVLENHLRPVMMPDEWSSRERHYYLLNHIFGLPANGITSPLPYLHPVDASSEGLQNFCHNSTLRGAIWDPLTGATILQINNGTTTLSVTPLDASAEQFIHVSPIADTVLFNGEPLTQWFRDYANNSLTAIDFFQDRLPFFTQLCRVIPYSLPTSLLPGLTRLEEPDVYRDLDGAHYWRIQDHYIRVNVSRQGTETVMTLMGNRMPADLRVSLKKTADVAFPWQYHASECQRVLPADQISRLVLTEQHLLSRYISIPDSMQCEGVFFLPTHPITFIFAFHYENKPALHYRVLIAQGTLEYCPLWTEHLPKTRDELSQQQNALTLHRVPLIELNARNEQLHLAKIKELNENLRSQVKIISALTQRYSNLTTIKTRIKQWQEKDEADWQLFLLENDIPDAYFYYDFPEIFIGTALTTTENRQMAADYRLFWQCFLNRLQHEQAGGVDGTANPDLLINPVINTLQSIQDLSDSHQAAGGEIATICQTQRAVDHFFRQNADFSQFLSPAEVAQGGWNVTLHNSTAITRQINQGVAELRALLPPLPVNASPLTHLLQYAPDGPLRLKALNSGLRSAFDATLVALLAKISREDMHLFQIYKPDSTGNGEHFRFPDIATFLLPLGEGLLPFSGGNGSHTVGGYFLSRLETTALLTVPLSPAGSSSPQPVLARSLDYRTVNDCASTVYNILLGSPGTLPLRVDPQFLRRVQTRLAGEQQKEYENQDSEQSLMWLGLDAKAFLTADFTASPDAAQYVPFLQRTFSTPEMWLKLILLDQEILFGLICLSQQAREPERGQTDICLAQLIFQAAFNATSALPATDSIAHLNFLAI